MKKIPAKHAIVMKMMTRIKENKMKIKKTIKKIKTKPKQIKKSMTFAEIIKTNPKAANKLAERGMFCCGCPMAMMETIEQGAEAHNVDVDELIEELNK